MYGDRKPSQKTEKITVKVQTIDRLIDENVPFEDVLAQINEAKSALHRAGQMVLEVISVIVSATA